jgi:hypothetical protein
MIARMSPMGDATYQYSSTVLSVFWPEAEHDKVIARWPCLRATWEPPGTSIGNRSSDNWPPARAAPCRCGPGRKYKQCCRPHGLGSLD